MSAYFLTGGTGIVGGAIAQQLLADPASRTTLLIRANSDGTLATRREELLDSWALPVGAAERVRIVRGDTSLPRFGLDLAAFRQLASECNRIIHCAAIMRMNLPLEEARRSAVEAARSVVALAREAGGSLEKVEFLSTVGVGGRRSGPLPERWITEPREYHNTYECAKAEAEEYLRSALDPAFPITVHQPSMVVGDSRTGRIARFQVFYHLAEFLTGQRTRGVSPSLGRTKLDLIPVDYVAQAVVWSSQQASTAGRILHLCAGPGGAIPLTKLRASVRNRFAAAGIRLPPTITVPTSLLKTALPALSLPVPQRARRALEILPMFLDYLAEDQSFQNTNTSALLTAAGIRLPLVADYLDRVLDYYLHHRKTHSD